MPRSRVSLLDDPAFLEELASLDLPESPVDLDIEPPAFFTDPPPASRRRRPRPGTPATGRIVLGILGFFTMMALGGAVAAFVFADRVARILAR